MRTDRPRNIPGTINERCTVELAGLAKKGRGVLCPEAVLEFAKNEDTALHAMFEWNDAKAAHEHRMGQARAMIANVTVVRETPDGHSFAVRAYVSLPSDRRDNPGTYRGIDNVMASTAMRSELIETARRELQAFRNKYAALVELSGVLHEIDRFLLEKTKSKVGDVDKEKEAKTEATLRRARKDAQA